MEIFWRLILAHFLADFTLQANVINAWKRKSVWGMLVHAAMHPLVSFVLVWPFLARPWLSVGGLALNGWACLGIIFILHFLEDEWRVYTIHRYHTPDNTLYFLWDQVIHFAIIFLLFPVMAGARGAWIPETWVILGILVVVVTHFSTVFIYFLEKDLWKGPFPGFDEKYLGMAERLALALLCLMPGWWAPPAAVLWFGFMWYLRRSRKLDFSGFGLWIGSAISVLSGAAARRLYFS